MRIAGRLFDSVGVGPVNYNGVVSFEAAPRALVIRCLAPFPFHRPIALPWESFELDEGHRIPLLGRGSLVIRGHSSIRVPHRVFDAVAKARAAALSAKA
jgi:hypothetical protein